MTNDVAHSNWQQKWLEGNTKNAKQPPREQENQLKFQNNKIQIMDRSNYTRHYKFCMRQYILGGGGGTSRSLCSNGFLGVICEFKLPKKVCQLLFMLHSKKSTS